MGTGTTIFVVFVVVVVVLHWRDISEFFGEYRRDVVNARNYGQHGIDEIPVQHAPEPEEEVPNRAEPEQGFVDDRPGPVEPPDDLALPPAEPKRLR